MIEALAGLPDELSEAVDKIDARLAMIAEQKEKQVGDRVTATVLGQGLPRALNRFVETGAGEWFITAAVASVIGLGILGVAVWGLSAYNYRQGYYAGMAESTATVKAAEGDLWSAVRPLTVDQAKVWSVLITQNPDVRAAIHDCLSEDGRTYCWFKLWTEPAKPPSSNAPPVQH